MGRYENCAYFYTFYDAVSTCFPNIATEDAETILRETILAPDDYEVEFSEDEIYNKPHIMQMIGRNLVKAFVHDSPQQTYNEIIESTATILKHMNDGYISFDDFEERSSFLNKIARYEFMLFAALAFFKSAQEDDEKVYNELILNIVRLREFRDILQMYTREEVNVEISREEFERALPIYRMLKSLQNLGYDYNLSPKERASLDIDHESDADLNDGFNFNNWLKRLMLLELRQELSAAKHKEETVAAHIHAEQNRLNDAQIGNKISLLRGTIDKRRFDKNRFIMLEQAQESDAEKINLTE